MTDRDRLIELIGKGQVDYYLSPDDDCGYTESLADFLMANGVTLLPLPIGSTVYEIRARGKRPALCGMRKCDYSIVSNSYIKNAIDHGFEFYVKAKKFVKYDQTRWNKTVFANRAEAEQALKEREGK